jgi:hypothetical protein
VPCRESIDSTKFPYVSYRVVLGAVSVPPAYLQQVVPTGEKPWAYWRKAGLVVRASGEAVTLSVPRAWQGRVAIAWGYGGHGVFSTLRICRLPCTADNRIRLLRRLRSSGRSACVPLIFRVGGRSATVRFGLGRRCG